MHYKIKELHKIITILANEEELSEHGQTLLEGYAVGLDTELASNTEIIGSVSDFVEYDENQATEFESRGEVYEIDEVVPDGYILKNKTTRPFWAGKTQVRSCR